MTIFPYQLNNSMWLNSVCAGGHFCVNFVVYVNEFVGNIREFMEKVLKTISKYHYFLKEDIQ